MLFFNTLVYNALLGTSEEKPMTAVILLLKDKSNEQSTNKTTHLHAPTHKPMLQQAKELFS
jgi:hypothetical protein